MDLPDEVGLVLALIDGIAKLVGLDNLCAGELIMFSDVSGMTLNLDHGIADAAVLGWDDLLFQGDIAERMETELFMTVGPNQVGEILDPLGNNLLGA